MLCQHCRQINRVDAKDKIAEISSPADLSPFRFRQKKPFHFAHLMFRIRHILNMDQFGHIVFKWKVASQTVLTAAMFFALQSSPLCKSGRRKSKCQTLLPLIWNCTAFCWCISCCTFQLKCCTVLWNNKVAPHQLILSAVSVVLYCLLTGMFADFEKCPIWLWISGQGRACLKHVSHPRLYLCTD